MRNNILRGIFILNAITFLLLLVTLPQTDCQTCELEYGGESYDGYEAYKFFEEGCISYNRPESYIYVNLDDINVSYTEDGIMNITFAEGYLK